MPSERGLSGGGAERFRRRCKLACIDHPSICTLSRHGQTSRFHDHIHLAPRRSRGLTPANRIYARSIPGYCAGAHSIRVVMVEVSTAILSFLARPPASRPRRTTHHERDPASHRPCHQRSAGGCGGDRTSVGARSPSTGTLARQTPGRSSRSPAFTLGRECQRCGAPVSTSRSTPSRF